MKLLCSPLALWFAVSLATAATPKQPSVAAEKPWALRNHFTFTLDAFRLEYAEDTAEWRVVEGESTVLAEKALFAVELGDGRTITPAQCGPPATTWGKASNALGDGAEYVLQFAPKDGLQVTHRLMTYKTQPYALIRLSVANTGAKAISVRKLCPAVFGASSFRAWGAPGRSGEWRFSLGTGYPRLGPEQPCVFKLFHDPGKKATLALGILPDGNAPASIEFSGGSGEVGTTYAPALELAPGQKAESETLWVSYGTPDPEQVKAYFVAALRGMTAPAGPALPQMTWCSVPAEAGFEQLLMQAKAWREAGVGFALIPAGWESAPGSLKGNAPHYPKSMAKALDALQKEGVAPGLTIDPLTSEKGWLNPGSEESKAAVAERMAKFRDWGAQFLSVTPSAIPDEQLAAFGVSRQEANRRAMACFAEAGGGIPVFPSAEATLSGTLEPWLEAAASAGWMLESGITPAPVRLVLDGGVPISDDVVAAMRLWPAAIEAVGPPAPGLGRFVACPRVQAHCIDTINPSPRLWQASFKAGGVFAGGAVLAFPGAPAWNVADLRMEQDWNVVLWRPEDGAYDTAPHPEAQKLEIHGVTPALDRPSLLGASCGLALHLDRVRELSWDANSNTLRGILAGPPEADGAVYIAVPDAWSLVSGVVNGKDLRRGEMRKLTGNRFSVKLEEKETRFELTFKHE